MKTKFVLPSLFIALAGLAGLATPAKAGTDVHLNINLGLPRLPVVIAPVRSHEVSGYAYSNRDFDRRDSRNDSCAPAPRGYWKEVTVKTWIPARWVVSRDRRGCEFRTYAPGYAAYRTERVWVSSDNDRRARG